jgi:hypothetical protein
MNYPIPKDKELFYFEKKIEQKKNPSNWFSRDEKNKYMDTYIKRINKFWSLYKSLPFVKEIFSIYSNKIQ